jgi:hypothetical protein
MAADIAMASAMMSEPVTSVVRRHVTPGDGQSAAYHGGRLPPRYPVPAIRHQVDVWKGRYGQRIFNVVYEIPDEQAWKIVGWEAIQHWA